MKSKEKIPMAITAQSSEGYPTIELRPKPGTEGQLMTGANTQVLMNGEKLPYVSAFKFEVNARGIAKVTLELYASVNIIGTVKEVKVALPESKV